MIRDRAVSHRYAAALFGASVKARAAETVLEDLGSLETLFERDERFQNFLEAPDVLTEDKVSLVERVLSGRAHELVARLLLLMLEKKRIQHLPLVLADFRELVEEHLGIARAIVTSAAPLAPDQAGELRTRLERLSGKKVRIDARVDPALLGGVVVMIGGKILDGSLKHRLEEMRERLMTASVL